MSASGRRARKNKDRVKAPMQQRAKELLGERGGAHDTRRTADIVEVTVPRSRRDSSLAHKDASLKARKKGKGGGGGLPPQSKVSFAPSRGNVASSVTQSHRPGATLSSQHKLDSPVLARFKQRKHELENASAAGKTDKDAAALSFEARWRAAAAAAATSAAVAADPAGGRGGGSGPGRERRGSIQWSMERAKWRAHARLSFPAADGADGGSVALAKALIDALDESTIEALRKAFGPKARLPKAAFVQAICRTLLPHLVPVPATAKEKAEAAEAPAWPAATAHRHARMRRRRLGKYSDSDSSSDDALSSDDSDGQARGERRSGQWRPLPEDLATGGGRRVRGRALPQEVRTACDAGEIFDAIDHLRRGYVAWEELTHFLVLNTTAGSDAGAIRTYHAHPSVVTGHTASVERVYVTRYCALLLPLPLLLLLLLLRPDTTTANLQTN